MLKMAGFCLMFLLTAYGFASAQTSSRIRNKLGKATSETYRFEKGVMVKADYDGEGEMCLLQISGRYFDISKLADELVPFKTRGRELEDPKSTSPATNYSSSSVYEYERVRMHVAISGENGNLRFIFKGRKCAEKPALAVSPILQSSNLLASNASLPGLVAPKPETALKQPEIKEQQVRLTQTRDWYGKYETTKPAVITHLPLPELTPEAVSEFTPGEMVVQIVLTPNGETLNMTLMGFLKKGMGERVIAAAGKIKFIPAQFDGRAVPQRTTIRYGIKKCDDGKVCTYAYEFVE